MLFGDADIEGAFGEFLGEAVQPGAGRHRGGDGHDVGVFVRCGDQCVGEHLGIGRGTRRRLGLLPGDDVELRYRVVLVRRFLGMDVAFALLGDDMHQDGAGLVGLAHVAQHRQQVVQIMTVDRADVVETQLLEQRAAGQDAASVFLGAAQRALDSLWEALGHFRSQLAQGEKTAGRHQPRQISTHGADRRGDRHVVVVEHDDQPRMAGAGVVHRFVGHAGAHGAVADHANDVAVVLLAARVLQVAGNRHAEAGGDGGGRMRGAERVVFALAAAGEARQAAGLTEGPNAVAAPSENFMRIGLMPHVPDQPVARGVEDRVDRDR